MATGRPAALAGNRSPHRMAGRTRRRSRYRDQVTTCRVLLISGSLRQGSGNSALLRTAQLVAPTGVTAVLYKGMGALPHFNPDDDRDPLPVPVAALRAAIQAADALLFSTPEYAGALPGSFKNLLDWTIGDDQPCSIYEKPVAWVNVSSAPTGAAAAYASLQTVLGYAHATIIEAACTPITVTRSDIDSNVDDGTIADPAIRASLAAVLTTLAASAGRPNR
jgi:chromate reductase